MSAGPLRRLVGILGLLALVPTAAMLTAGTITLEDAALRAGATLLAAWLLGKVAGWWLSFLAREFERAGEPGVRAPAQPAGSAARGRGS